MKQITRGVDTTTIAVLVTLDGFRVWGSTRGARSNPNLLLGNDGDALLLVRKAGTPKGPRGGSINGEPP